MSKALFLDRDGVLNRESGDYSFLPEHFELLPNVIPSLLLAMEKGYLLIVISNQGGIAKGLFSKEDVERFHQQMTEKLAAAGVRLDEIYYCPHHSEIGRCLCRKPDSLLLEKAIARFDIDVERSVMVGDAQRDLDAAEQVGVRGIRIPSNSSMLQLVNDLK